MSCRGSRRRSISLLMALSGLALLAIGAGAQGDRPALIAAMQGVINPPMADYVGRVLDDAQASNAAVVIFEMDTPGGLESSMRDIVKRMIASPVPVVVYVAPPGARAGSAGVFITYASHVAAMAPDTNIGSAHPVALGESGERQISEEMKAKVTNDAAAFVKGLAERRGRNAEWAEQAVRESLNITASEAQRIGVVELIAPDSRTLLQQLHGRRVETSQGIVELQTEGARQERADMSAVERILHVISDPTIAYLLLSLGGIGLFLELSNPGSVLPGVAGAISLLLAFYALGTLPVNYAGLALIGLALALFIVDVFATSHGILTAGGVMAFVLGSLMLFNVPEAGPLFSLSLQVILAVSATLAAFFAFIVGAAIRGQRRRVAVGVESMIGMQGEARTDLKPRGLVHVGGELWEAESGEHRVRKGEAVEVDQVVGLRLKVRPLSRPRA